MTAVSFAPGDSQTSPDFLAALVSTSEIYSIVASQDIVDVRGLKLWAKGLPVSAVLQQRLLERKLRYPLETCLMAEDGVTPFYLMEQLKTFLATDHSMAQALRPHALLLEKHLQQLPLHSVALLLLTTALATRPGSIAHAVRAMAMAGGMAQAQATPVDMRLASLDRQALIKHGANRELVDQAAQQRAAPRCQSRCQPSLNQAAIDRLFRVQRPHA